MLQREALEILKTGANVFLTGVPGAGKTYVINKYIKYLEDKGIYPAITASTGIAATHVGGTTIHSYSGIGIETNIDQYKLEKILEREKLVKRIQNTKVLIIDEISMLDATTLDNVNKVLKEIKNPTLPFGGVQVIFVGDFFQLPPVTRRGEIKNYCFVSTAWKEAKPLTCYLEEQYRQSDKKFTKLLLAIRENNIEEMHVEILDDLIRKTNKKFGFKTEIKKSEESYEEETVDYYSPSPTLPDREGDTKYYRTANTENYDSLKLKAIEMRKNPTGAEELMWENLRNSNFGAKFRRQHLINDFIVDFVNLEKKLIIEVDGQIHNFQKEKDEERIKVFEDLGYSVLRFGNDEIYNNLNFVLNKIKQALTPSLSGRVGEGHLNILELHSHNKNVDEINEINLKNLEGREFVYNMLSTGSRVLVEGLIKSCLSPEVLKLKVGAKVIFTKNSLEGEYANGTLATVLELETFSIKVQTKNGKVINVTQADWSLEEDGKVKAKLTQYPLRLAWAITVHKSQGMSLDEALINLGETFEYGQGYVALSRIRSLSGLYLKSYNAKALRVNEAISEFDEKIRKDSRFIQNKFLKADIEKLQKTQSDFILKSGGTLEGWVSKKSEIKKPTAEITMAMILEGKTMQEILEARDMKFESVIKHIEQLLNKNKIKKADLEKLASVNIFSIPNEVKKSFKKNMLKKDEEGNIKLAPVFKDLKEKYSYEDLRWYRLFL